MALFQDDFWPAISHDDTGCETIAYAHSATSWSDRISSCFLELEKVNQDLESKLRNDFSNILNSMDKLSLSHSPRSPSPPLNPSTRTISSIHNSSFTTVAYSWLLENIANPYPSSTVKAFLVQQYNYSLSAVSTWFINARRRIGWTALCRDHFSNCRADALDAAYRALVNEDPNRPLPPSIIHAFVSVKAAAEGLYSSTFPQSALAGDLDALVGDTTDQDTILVGERKHCELKEMAESQEASEAESRNKTLVAQQYSPSSERSYFSSSVPPLDESLTDDSEEDEVLPSILAGRKRRLSCSEPVHETISVASTKRRKRLCSASPPLTCQPSSGESLEALIHNENPRCRPISTNIIASRKRRLSDADATGIPKYPLELSAGPRLHAVSDPVPLFTVESDHAIDEWFNSNFDTLFALPPPVDVFEPDLSAQWEVELFSNYNIPEEPQKRPFWSLNPSTGDQVSTSVDSFALDEFLQSLESGGFVMPSEIPDPSIAVLDADSAARDLSLLESMRWTPPNWQMSEPSLDSVFGSSHADSLSLPEIDLSTLQLP